MYLQLGLKVKINSHYFTYLYKLDILEYKVPSKNYVIDMETHV